MGHHLMGIAECSWEIHRTFAINCRTGGCGIGHQKLSPAIETVLGVLLIRCPEITVNRRRRPSFLICS